MNKIVNLNRITKNLLPLTVVLMEVLWAYPWLILMGRWPILVEQHLPLSLASLVFLLGGSFLLTRFGFSRRWSLARRRLGIIGCGLLAILIVLRIEYPGDSGLLDGRWLIDTARLMVASFVHPHPVAISLFVGLYLWWRGIGLGYSPLRFENIYRYFTVGLLAQVVLIIAWGAGSPGESMSTIGLYVAGFFASGLSALTLSRLQGMRERVQDKEARAGFSGRWFAIIAVVIGGIVLVGIGVASIFSPGFLSVLGRGINLVSGLLFKVIFYISTVAVTIVGFVIGITIYIVQTLINMLQGEIPTDVSSSGNMTPLQELKQGVSRTMSSEAILVMKWVFFGLIVAAAIFLIGRAILRYTSGRKGDDIEEIHESLWSWRGFVSDLRLFLKPLTQRFRGIKLAGASSHGRRRAGRLSIREIYQLLLWQASQLGIARRNHETPYEYGKRLGQALRLRSGQAVPEGGRPLGELTDLYISVRYGDLAAGEKEVDYANGLWAKIEQQLGSLETKAVE